MNYRTSSSALFARIAGLTMADGETDPNNGGGGGGESQPAMTPEQWQTLRASLAGGDQERSKVLEAYDAPDKLFGKLTEKPPEFDWRKAMAGDDPEELKALERYTDPVQARKAWKEAVAKISEGGKVKVPGENATPEEIAEFNKALGVPESPDKYEITAKPVDGYEVSDADKSFLNGMTARLHDAIAKGAKPKDIVNLAHQLYYDAAADSAIAQETAAAEAAAEGEKQNRDLWGSQYDANIKLAIAGAKHVFPGTDAEFEKAMGMRLETGHALFDHPLIQRIFAQAALEMGVNEDPFFLAAKNNEKGFDPEARKREILAMRDGSSAQREEYKKLSAPGGELEKLNAVLARKGSKAA